MNVNCRSAYFSIPHLSFGFIFQLIHMGSSLAEALKISNQPENNSENVDEKERRNFTADESSDRLSEKPEKNDNDVHEPVASSSQISNFAENELDTDDDLV